MKITFLGTSHGYAEKNRFTSATLVEAGPYAYLIDAGAPVEALMVNNDKPYSQIRGIFITHMHSDHAGSLSSVIEPMMGYRRNDKATCFLPTQAGLEGLFGWLDTLHTSSAYARSVVRFAVTHEGLCFEDEYVRVSGIPTRHLPKEQDLPSAWSYLVEADGKSVLFTGDMSGGFPEFAENVQGRHFDLIVCEMAHADLSKVWPALFAADTDKMILNHYHMPRLEGMEALFPKAPFPISLANDGMVLAL